MGLLDNLWDDVVAGPQPDHGLSLLHKQPGFPRLPEDVVGESTQQIIDCRRSRGVQQHPDETRHVSQSITIKKRPQLNITSFERSGSLPSTPAGASSPTSPVSGPSSATQRENVWRGFFHPRSNNAMNKIGSEKFVKAQPNSPTVYDWIVITSLDR